MYISRSRGYNGTYYLSARCENKECSRKPRAVRVKVILVEIYRALGELKFDGKDYNRHLKYLKEYVDVKLDKLIIEKRSLLGTKRRKQAKINEYATTYSKFDSTTPEIVKQNRVFYRYKDPIELAHKYIISTFGARERT